MTKDTLYVRRAPGAPFPPGTVELRELFGELRRGRLFRSREARLLAYDLEVMPRPLLSALAIRLAGRSAWMEDAAGKRERVTSAALLRRTARAALDLARIPALLRRTRRRMAELGGPPHACRTPGPGAAPVYLRTDLWFGVRAGGSVGHVAGVANELGRFCGSPVVLTTDALPLLDPAIEVHRIPAPREFWDFPGLLPLLYNETIPPFAGAALEGREASFIYQRSSLGSTAGLELARAWRVPLVLEFNGSEVWAARNWSRPAPHEGLMRDLEALSLRAAHLVVAVSDAARDQAVEQGADPGRVLVNPNGVDPRRFHPDVDGAAVRARYGLGEKVVVGFIGTFGPWHGAELLAAAFGRFLAEHPERRGGVRLLMIGDGVRLAAVRAALARHGVDGEAVLAGLVPQAEGPAHLAACDVLVSPQLPNVDGTPFFGSPTKLFEYMAMGRAILASRLEQIGQVLRHGETGWLVEPGSVPSLTAGLHALLGDSALRRRLGEAARRQAVERHSWQEHTRRIVHALGERRA